MANKATVTYNGAVISTEERDGNFPVTYDGSTIATVEPGQTKVLNCAGKLMKTNVVIGGRTLNCAKYKMASDVTVSVESLGIVLSDLPEGTLISINENGSPVPFYLACHNYESENNGAGRTLLVRKTLYSKRKFRSSGNLYSGSDIDNFLTGTYANYLNAAVKTAAGQTKIKVTSKTGSFTASVGTIDRSVFLLSVAEYGLSGGKAEGSALPIASSIRQTSYNNTYTAHWTRTPYYSDTEYAYYLTTTGTVTNAAATTSWGVRPAFTLPNTLLANSTPNSDGSYTLLV